MATIRQLSSGNWNVQIRRKGRKNISKTFECREDAAKWSEDQSKNIDQHLSLLELGERYCDEALRGKPTQTETVKQINRICCRLVAKSIPLEITEISKADINCYKLDRLKVVAPATCRKELMLISRVVNWGIREYLLEIEDPVGGIALPSASKPRDRVVNPEELMLLMTELTPVMAMIVEIAYETAMRRSEIVNLQVKHLHLEERFLEVLSGKTGDRLVPLTLRAVDLLKNAMENCPDKDSRLFLVQPHSVTSAVRKARRKVGLDDSVRLHQLRHTRVTLAARNGLNQAQLMAISGHRDVRSLQRYTHLSVYDVIKFLD